MNRMTTETPTLATPRLRSLDALRGFDMLWIVGGGSVVAALAATTDNALVQAIEAQTHHVPWNGFTLWDLIFPLFLFIAGVATPYSIEARREAGATTAELARRVVRRGAVLVLFGMIYNGLLAFELDELRCASVLGRIGLGYAGAGLIVVFARSVRTWALWVLGILVAYCLAMNVVPVPEYGAGNLTPGATLADFLDRKFLPGKLYHGDRDPEGLFSTIPAVATALLGALAGAFLRARGRAGRTDASTALVLFAAGLAGLALGWVWSLWFPLNKNLWTSSFVLWTAGASSVLLALSYLAVDVWKWERVAFFFVVIGRNAITIYLLGSFVDFEGLARLVFARGEGRLHPAIYPALGLALRWLVLYAMYRRRIFLRV